MEDLSSGMVIVADRIDVSLLEKNENVDKELWYAASAWHLICPYIKEVNFEYFIAIMLELPNMKKLCDNFNISNLKNLTHVLLPKCTPSDEHIDLFHLKMGS